MEEKDNGYVENTQAETTASADKGAERQERCPKPVSTAIGKFKDVDALLKAYDCLQAEFTRRSQRLKQLEKEAENSENKRETAEAVEKLRKNAEKTRSETEKFDGFVAELERANVRARLDGELLRAEPATLQAETDETQASALATQAQPVQVPSTDAAVSRDERNGTGEKDGDGQASFSVGESVADCREKRAPSSEELYRLASADEQVRLKIIGEYLNSVGKSGAPLIKGGNGLLSAPPIKAKTVREAGEMALRWFRKESAKA